MKIAIIDDEEHCRIKIRELIERQKDAGFCEILSFCDGKELLSHDVSDFDIVYLDIEMQESLGVDVATEIKQINKDIIIIFVTSHSQYVSDAFRIGAFQYVPKPIDKTFFANEFNRAVNNIRNIKNMIEISWNGEQDYLRTGDIIFIEYNNRKMIFNMVNTKLKFSHGNMKIYFELLNQFGFVQCHNSFILNSAYLVRINGYNAELKNGVTIPICKKYYKEVKEKFREKISGAII